MSSDGQTLLPVTRVADGSVPGGPDPLRTYIPPTISPEAATVYEDYRAFILAPPPVPPTTVAEFEALYQAGEPRGLARAAEVARMFGPTIADIAMEGSKVVEVRPSGYRDDGTVIIHVHGGAFALGSARSNLPVPIMLAAATGRRMLSVDYTVAPKGRWALVTDQVIAVYRAVLSQGTRPECIGMTGESAGGNIVVASILKARDQGLPLPAGVMLVSPLTDLGWGGDTRTTLAEADPVLRPRQIEPCFEAYVDPTDFMNPYVSPVYGDFGKGFPPLLIQGGTKESLLSDMVRLHRAVRAAGGDCRLELYEDMPHCFQVAMAEAPEGKEALAEQADFWMRHLQPGKP